MKWGISVLFLSLPDNYCFLFKCLLQSQRERERESFYTLIHDFPYWSLAITTASQGVHGQEPPTGSQAEDWNSGIGMQALQETSNLPH